MIQGGPSVKNSPPVINLTLKPNLPLTLKPNLPPTFKPNLPPLINLTLQSNSSENDSSSSSLGHSHSSLIDHTNYTGVQALSLVYPPTPVRVRGIYNRGNTCFANACLQVLFSSPDIRALIHEGINDIEPRSALAQFLKSYESLPAAGVHSGVNAHSGLVI